MMRKKKLCFIGVFALCLIVIISFIGFLIWRSGALFRLDKQVSPDGKHIVQVFSKKGTHNIFNFSNEDIVHIYEQTVVSETELTDKDGRVIKKEVTVQDDGHSYFGGKESPTEYEGLWWSPDSKKFALALRIKDDDKITYQSHPHLIYIIDNEANVGTHVIGPQEIYAYMTNQIVFDIENFPKCDYEFIKWGQDSESILLYYTYEENGFHDGYCWYNYKSGEITPCSENELN